MALYLSHHNDPRNLRPHSDEHSGPWKPNMKTVSSTLSNEWLTTKYRFSTSYIRFGTRWGTA